MVQQICQKLAVSERRVCKILGQARTTSDYSERLSVTSVELESVNHRLERLYDALETGKISLDDLGPRIRELRARQNQLSKVRVQVEAEIVAQGTQQVDVALVQSYAQDLRSLLGEADFTESKAFLRSFIKRIEINREKAIIHYNLPMPPDGKKRQSVGVLPIVTPSGPYGTAPELLFEKKELIPALQQLLASYPNPTG